MVFKVLSCTLLACTLTQASVWRPFGLIHSVGNAAFDTLHENIDSAKKSVDAGLEGGKSLYDASVQAAEAAVDVGLTVPRFGLKLGEKLSARSDNSEAKGNTEGATSAPSTESEKTDKSVSETEDAVKEESTTQSKKSGQSVNDKLTYLFDNANDAASETLNENNKSIKKSFHAGLDATNSIFNAGMQKANTGWTWATSPFRFGEGLIKGFKLL